MYRNVPWFVFLSLIPPECVYQCPAILSLIVGVYLCLLIRVALFLFLWRFLFLFGYNYCDWMYVYRYVSGPVSSLCISFSLILSECVYQCSAILSLIVGVYVRLLIRVSLCFSEGFYSAIIIETDCTCIGTSPDPPLSLSLFVSASGYIIGNLHIYEQVWSVHSACNCA